LTTGGHLVSDTDALVVAAAYNAPAGHHNIFGKIVIEGADIDDDVVVRIDDAATAIGSDC
jgi:hypothetical protein